MLTDTERYPWDPGRDVRFFPERKHAPKFPKGFPFLLRFYRFAAGLPISPNYHDYLEIFCVHHGSGMLFIEDKTYRMRNGDIFLIGNDEFHSLQIGEPGSLEAVAIYFLPRLVHSPGGYPLDVEYLRPFYDKRRGFSHRIPQGQFPETLLPGSVPAMFDELTRKKPGYRLAVKSLLLAVLVGFVRYYEKRRPAAAFSPDPRPQFQKLTKVFDYLRENYQQPIALRTAAGMAGMSVSYFAKVFKRTTGGSLLDLVLRMRVDKASQLLIQTDLPITEIAFRVGFENHSYFDRVFRRLARTTPREYRRKVRAQIALR
ncbi:MAG: helix-turn-helix transcriptional regulator [Kiritimatiellae bacterium]|nr:helix-turn-helix transcriptional regulator [Kiritimatiellia bacterium]